MKSTCYICGAPIASDGRDTPIYCTKHMKYAEKDAEILRNLSLNDTFSLCAGILRRAKEDYIYNIKEQRSDAEWFFRSAWAQTITNGALDPDKAIEELDRRIDELKRTGVNTERTEWE